MSNFKWGSISAICALFISVVLGMGFGVGVSLIIIRALIFSAVFFGAGFGLRFILDSFFPELLYMSEETDSSEAGGLGGQKAIAIDAAGEYAVPELFNKKGDSQELGNIEDLISGGFRHRAGEDGFDVDENRPAYPNFDFSMSSDEGIDRNKEAGYNDSGTVQDIPFREGAVDFSESSVYEKPAVDEPAADKSQFTPSFGEDSGLGGLPDLDMMAMAFSSGYTTAPAPAASSASSMPSAHPVEEYEPDRSQYKGNKPQTLEGDFDPKSLAEGIRTVLKKN